MTVLYLVTTPPPKFDGSDALHNTVTLLAQHFHASVENLYPFQRPLSWYPRALYGRHRAQELKNLIRKSDIVHVFSPTPAWYPILASARDRRIFLSVVAGIPPQSSTVGLQNYDCIITSNSRDQMALSSLQGSRIFTVRPGIKSSHIQKVPANQQPNMHLMVASAPWTRRQFRTKGIDLLLQLADLNKEIEITLLWRDFHVNLIMKKWRQLSPEVRKRVHVVNEHVNINAYMKKVDAVIVLAESSDLVKAHPHSLVESLAAGKPILISRAIPMSDYVDREKCGVVVESLNLLELNQKVKHLLERYALYQRRAQEIGAKDFMPDRYLSEMGNLYSKYLTQQEA